MKWLVVSAALALAACGGESAAVRPISRDALEAAARKNEPLRELNEWKKLACRRTTLEKYRRAASGRSTDPSHGC